MEELFDWLKTKEGRDVAILVTVTLGLGAIFTLIALVTYSGF